jgi:hypothetical protein
LKSAADFFQQFETALLPDFDLRFDLRRVLRLRFWSRRLEVATPPASDLSIEIVDQHLLWQPHVPNDRTVSGEWHDQMTVRRNLIHEMPKTTAFAAEVASITRLRIR